MRRGGVPWRESSRSSQAFAIFQSRNTVSGEMRRTSACFLQAQATEKSQLDDVAGQTKVLT